MKVLLVNLLDAVNFPDVFKKMKNVWKIKERLKKRKNVTKIKNVKTFFYIFYALVGPGNHALGGGSDPAKE